MSKDFGEIEYDESEFLNLGANYEKIPEKGTFLGNAELDIIDLKEDKIEDEEDDEFVQKEIFEKTEIEAKFVQSVLRN